MKNPYLGYYGSSSSTAGAQFQYPPFVGDGSSSGTWSNSNNGK